MRRPGWCQRFPRVLCVLYRVLTRPLPLAWTVLLVGAVLVFHPILSALAAQWLGAGHRLPAAPPP